MSDLLTVENLTRHFSVRVPGKGLGGMFGQPATLKAVDGVSFSVESGRTLGVVGESGCGKSTTAKLVLGLLPPTAGAVRFEGTDVPAKRNRNWRDLRQRMQMVYQDPLGALDRRLPVVTQVMEPLTVFRIGTPAERREKAHELMG